MTLNEPATETREYIKEVYSLPYEFMPMQPGERLQPPYHRVFRPGLEWFGDVVGIRGGKWFVRFDADCRHRVTPNAEILLISPDDLRIIDDEFERVYRNQQDALWAELRGEPQPTGNGTKACPAQDMVEAYLRKHPEDISLSHRKIAAKVGVSETPVAAVLKRLRK